MTTIPHTTPDPAQTGKPLAFNAHEFCHYLADSDWTQEQKVEFIEALWQIVVSFVDLGFDLHPIQRASDASPALEPDSRAVLGSLNLQNFETTNAGFNHRADAGRPDS